MTYREMVAADYQEYIAMDITIPSELKRSLKAHERIPAFFDNMVQQLNLLPKNRKYDRLKIKMLVHEMTKQFIFMVKMRTDQQYQSDLESERQRAEQQRLEDLEKTSEGDPSGIYGDLYEELGVIREDTLVKERPDESEESGQNGPSPSRGNQIIT